MTILRRKEVSPIVYIIQKIFNYFATGENREDLDLKGQLEVHYCMHDAHIHPTIQLSIHPSNYPFSRQPMKHPQSFTLCWTCAKCCIYKHRRTWDSLVTWRNIEVFRGRQRDNLSNTTNRGIGTKGYDSFHNTMKMVVGRVRMVGRFNRSPEQRGYLS